MSPLPVNFDHSSRREFLWRFGGGLGGIALAQLLGRHDLLAAPAQPRPRADLNGGIHHRARVKRIVQLFMNGGASQMDLFDYKPELIKRHGQKFDPGGKIGLFQSTPGAAMARARPSIIVACITFPP